MHEVTSLLCYLPNKYFGWYHKSKWHHASIIFTHLNCNLNLDLLGGPSGLLGTLDRARTGHVPSTSAWAMPEPRAVVLSARHGLTRFYFFIF